MDLIQEDNIGGFTLRYAFYEAIFSQDVFLSKLSSIQRYKLLNIVLRNYDIKEAYSDEVYFIYDLKTTTIIAARLMRLAKYAPFMNAMAKDDYLRVFVEEIELQGRVESLSTVIKYARTFNQQQLIKK